MPPPSNTNPETVAIVARPRECEISRFRVRVLAGANQGIEKVSEDVEISIGVAPGNHLLLTDRAVSRHHCIITATKDGFLLRDLGSRNGTMLGGFRISAAYLKHGAQIGIGESVLGFETLHNPIVEPLAEEERYGRVLGQSVAMRRIFTALPRVAASDSTILIEGETGTGKGLLSEVIHQKSPRATGPFVVIDCSAIPPTLIEAELFGHVKGAFTGAQGTRAGAFEAADGGTVFLDEVGELPLDMQPKLLRALEERTVRRIGSLEPIRLDVRVVAATNRDLREEVNRGSFRSDLFYRLNTVRIRLPSLRDRREDIPLLISYFYEQFAGENDPAPSADLITAFVRQDWPGNVRELRSAVERAILMKDPELWFDATLGGPPSSPLGSQARDYSKDLAIGSFRTAKERAVAQWERGYVDALIRASDGNLSRAARAARMDRNHLRELIRRHGVSASDD
jgi:DNA-binding NtrC family response regulator